MVSEEDRSELARSVERQTQEGGCAQGRASRRSRSVHRTRGLGLPGFNAIAAVSHKPAREREGRIHGFKFAAQAQRFLAVHGTVQNLFRVGRRHLKAVHSQLLRNHALTD